MNNLESILCNKCFKKLEYQKIGFRDSCPYCGAELHSCENCKFFYPGAYNDCLEPQAERVVDKFKANLCEFFQYQTKTSKPRADFSKLEDLFKKK